MEPKFSATRNIYCTVLKNIPDPNIAIPAVFFNAHVAFDSIFHDSTFAIIFLSGCPNISDQISWCNCLEIKKLAVFR